MNFEKIFDISFFFVKFCFLHINCKKRMIQQSDSTVSSNRPIQSHLVLWSLIFCCFLHQFLDLFLFIALFQLNANLILGSSCVYPPKDFLYEKDVYIIFCFILNHKRTFNIFTYFSNFQKLLIRIFNLGCYSSPFNFSALSAAIRLSIISSRFPFRKSSNWYTFSPILWSVILPCG